MIEEFFKEHGINCLTSVTDEPEFSGSCDVCGQTFIHYIYLCNGFNPTLGQIQIGYQICPECLYRINYGD